jgi:pyruvate/2-oxoglutarate dehydrogenase complex dihydrolipoamide acyltransferase (E2) component
MYMVHLRAKNLPEKGKVEKWLFETDVIKSGDDFALVRTVSNQEIVIKSHIDGVVVKTLKLGSIVKNGSVLANIAVGTREIAKVKNKSFVEGEEPVNVELEELDLSSDGFERLHSAEDELDEISGAVMYDRNYQAPTPFSSGDEIMNTPAKYQQIVKRDEEMKEQEDKNVAPAGGLKNRFAQMRANIASSIKNNPNAKMVNLSDDEKDKLAGMSNEEALQDGNLFNADNSAGVSKFRQLIQSRKEKLLKENDFQEVKDEDLQIDAMSKLDEKGRPLIMRNIIANRLEKFNQSGGDPAAVDRDIVATKDNAVKNYKAKPSEILMDGVDKYIKPDIPEEEATPNMYKTDKQKIVDSTVKEGPFARQRASDDGEFGVTYGTYVDDEEHMDVDLNEVTNSGATMMPKKRKTELLDEIKQKSTKSYAESKLANLYDSNRRWEIIKSRNDVSEIQKRKHQMEGGGAVEHSDESVSETAINGVEIPAFFLNETIVQDESGRVDYVQFKETQEGKIEFENWLRANNLYATYSDAKEDPTMVVESHAPKKTHQTQMDREELERTFEEFSKPLEGGVVSDSSTIGYLKQEIEELKQMLEEKNQLKKAERQLQNEAPSAPSTDQTFSQMMQLMMMQNLMQNMNHGANNNAQTANASNEDIKKMIQVQLENFKDKMLNEKPNHQNGDLNYVDVNKRDNLNEIKPNNNISHPMNVENENNILQREAINPNSLPAVKSMILSQSYIPPLTISTEVDMTSILKLKHVLKKTDPNTLYSTILFIAKSLSLALTEYPKINSSYDPESNEVIVKVYHNIGLATETSEGLIIPVLKFVEKLSLKELAIDIQEMTTRLRRGELFNYETSGSTITLANYGNIGAIQATPTIFYPNAAVVGVGKVIKKPVVVENEKLAIKAMMNVSLTVDQRIIDNATAGRFLARMKEILEKPELLMVS